MGGTCVLCMVHVECCYCSSTIFLKLPTDQNIKHTAHDFLGSCADVRSFYHFCTTNTTPFLNVQSPLRCYNCPAGYMQGGKGKASCQLCSPGKFTSASGQVMCTSCPAEYYRPEEPEESQLEDSKESKQPNNHSNATTTTNTTRRVPASSCFECDIGRTTNGGTSSSSCTACGAGKVSSSPQL